MTFEDHEGTPEPEDQSEEEIKKVYSGKRIDKYNIETTDKNCIILHPKEAHCSSFVWLHGIGETADNYVNKFLDEFMELPSDCKIIIPTAPVRYVTDIERKITSWFDIRSFHMPDEEDELDKEYFSRSFAQNELKESAIMVLELLQKEREILGGPENIYLGGF